MKLPAEFTNRMKNLLGVNEYKEFIRSFDEHRHYGIRVNTLKVAVEDFLDMSPFELEPIPWTKDGFYYRKGESPGRHPYYYAGIYYIQEPSAMFPAEVLAAIPGERVLDLCAAPGGKTVQIAAGMKGQGILVANDISPNRVKALVKNIELYGIKNAVVTKDSPEALSKKFIGYFDRILVDAPCSGEGMFRKDQDAIKSWHRFKYNECAAMQEDILKYADIMLKPGGRLVYSTCTFSPEENELMISKFLKSHKDYRLKDIPKENGIEKGRASWAGNNKEIEKTARLWPHRLRGEGHFIALLEKAGERVDADAWKVDDSTQSKCEDGKKMQVIKRFFDFTDEYLNTEIKGCFYMSGENLYCMPEPFPDLGGVKVAKFGWYLGQLKGDRFEPSHSLAVSLSKDQVKNTLDLKPDSVEVLKYLKGETLMFEGNKGYTAVCVDGYTLGWAKQTGQMLKNVYPKGWRKLI
ncbi:MAG: RsmF rRNA methyltransferase first C-terminal domain-containing protein [Acetivibrionales bacterium]|jgi:NOL1/NOP2/sun family putative RNA methylase